MFYLRLSAGIIRPGMANLSTPIVNTLHAESKNVFLQFLF